MLVRSLLFLALASCTPPLEVDTRSAAVSFQDSDGCGSSNFDHSRWCARNLPVRPPGTEGESPIGICAISSIHGRLDSPISYVAVVPAGNVWQEVVSDGYLDNWDRNRLEVRSTCALESRFKIRFGHFTWADASSSGGVIEKATPIKGHALCPLNVVQGRMFDSDFSRPPMVLVAPGYPSPNQTLLHVDAAFGSVDDHLPYIPEAYVGVRLACFDVFDHAMLYGPSASSGSSAWQVQLLPDSDALWWDLAPVKDAWCYLTGVTGQEDISVEIEVVDGMQRLVRGPGEGAWATCVPYDQ